MFLYFQKKYQNLQYPQYQTCRKIQSRTIIPEWEITIAIPDMKKHNIVYLLQLILNNLPPFVSGYLVHKPRDTSTFE